MTTNDMPKETTLRWAWVKYQLEIKGYSLAGLGREIGVERAALIKVKGQSYPKMQKAIADKLVMLPQEIWPERYGCDGRPIKHSPRYPRHGKGIIRGSQQQCTK